jgi:hypothetical protein
VVNISLPTTFVESEIHEVPTSLSSVVVGKFEPVFRQQDWRPLISSRIYSVTTGKCWDNDIKYTVGCFFSIFLPIFWVIILSFVRTRQFFPLTAASDGKFPDSCGV